MLLLFKKITHFNITLVFLLITSVVAGQVSINKSLQFTNENDSLSQIYNLGGVTDSTSLLKLGNSLNEKIISLTMNGTGVYSFTPPYSNFTLQEGMQFHLLVDTNNNVSPKINYNSLIYPIIFQNGDTIRPFQLENNSIARVVFDGNSFILAQYFRNSCPPGFFSVNENYCIEIYERPPVIYTNAVAKCNSIGASLCSWSEWYYACNNLNGVSVFQMGNNWEYLDDASDHTNTYAIVGNGPCTSFYSENVNLFNRNYRCCYKK